MAVEIRSSQDPDWMRALLLPIVLRRHQIINVHCESQPTRQWLVDGIHRDLGAEGFRVGLAPSAWALYCEGWATTWIMEEMWRTLRQCEKRGVPVTIVNVSAARLRHPCVGLHIYLDGAVPAVSLRPEVDRLCGDLVRTSQKIRLAFLIAAAKRTKEWRRVMAELSCLPSLGDTFPGGWRYRQVLSSWGRGGS